MCTKEETIKTGINIDTVKLSKLKAHNTLSDSLSIHLKRFIDTGMLFKPTSKKATIANNVVKITHKLVINCAPLTPTFLPKNPATIAPNNGKVIIAKYIIYILLQYFLLIYKKQLEYLNLSRILLQLLL
ncbi:hypothetical protein OR221_2174 [Microbacterium laevaniformans OR221]|nr:hypothetical protein OR221_2174 [Microbacterium laevaniformans OR221]